MDYEWDERKRQINLHKHHIDFADAVHFNWESAWVLEDTKADYGEQRFNACGFLLERLVVISFTVRNERIRIISLRKATRYEQAYYGH